MAPHLTILALALCAHSSIPSDSRTFVIESSETASFLGSALANLGDLDGDGVDELALGAFGADRGRGRASIFRMFDDAPLSCSEGARADELYGLALDVVGDVNGDGVADWIVGAPGAEPKGIASGCARLLSGKDGSILREYIGETPHDEFGASVAGAGDVDRDGVADFLIGSPGIARKGYAIGRAALYSGRTLETLRLWGGESGEDRFGGLVAGLGDVDGDGFADVAVSALQVLGPRPGYVRIYSGIDGLMIGRYGGKDPGDAFGTSIASLGDVDGDGAGELAIGAYLASQHAAGAGSVQVISIDHGRVRYTLHGETAGEQFGAALATLADLDGDGAKELAIGSPRAGRGAGSVRIVSGKSGATLTELHGERAFERYGATLVGLVGAHGPALAIGAPENGSRSALGGRVYVVDLASLALQGKR